MRYRLGKRPARAGAIKFGLDSYVDRTALPPTPATFGMRFMPMAWGMYGNDRVGDCVLAGGAHETMKWGLEGGQNLHFTDFCVLSDYSAITGYRPGDLSTDQGTDMQAAASYRRKTGIVDVYGKRHTIDAYAEIKVGDLDAIAFAAWQLGAVGIGFNLPDTAEGQFDKGQGQPWSVVPGASAAGGHYVPVIGRNSAGNFLCVTWGRLQAITPDFVREYMDEGVAYLSIERLRNNLSPDQVDLATLQRDLAALPAA